MKSYNADVEEYGALEPYTAEEIEELKSTTYISPIRFKRLMATLDRELDRKDTQPPKHEGISWREYDPNNTPEYGKNYLITDGHAVDIGYLMQPIEYDDEDFEDEPARWYPPDRSNLNHESITHYAEITLPVEDTQGEGGQT